MRTPYAGQDSATETLLPELYLDNAVVLYAQSRCFADPDVVAAFANEFNSKSGQ